MKGRRIALAVGVLLAIQLVALALCRGFSRRESFEAYTSEDVAGRLRVPELQLERPDGSRIALGEIASGRPLLLHFWASWCPPCRKELPTLLHRSWDGAGLVVSAVAVEDAWSAIRRVAGEPVPASVVRLLDAAPLRALGVTGLPETWLGTSDGRIVRRYSGARDWSRQGVAEELELATRAAARRP